MNRDFSKYAHLGVLGAIVLFTFIFTMPLLQQGYPNGGDSVGHYDLVLNTIDSIKHFFATGELSLWNEDYYFGFPLFFYYAPLPYVVLALLSIVTGISALTLFKLSMVVLFSLLPLLFYKVGKLLDLDNWTSTALGFVSPLLSSISVFGLEYYAFFATGLYSQLFALLFFPFVLAYSYRVFVKGMREEHFLILFLSLSFVSHFLVGFIACCVVGLFFVSALSTSSNTADKLSLQTRRLLLVVSVFLLLVSFLVVPYFLHGSSFGNITFDLAHKTQGYGLVDTLTHLLEGNLLDYSAAHTRLPLLSVLFGLGLLVVIFSKDVREKHPALRLFVLLSVVFSVICVAGQASFGFFSWLPFFSSIQTFRFIFLFHFAALFCIAFAFSFVIGYAKRFSSHALLGVLIILLLSAPALYERVQTMQEYSYAHNLESEEWYWSIISNMNTIGRDGRTYIPFSAGIIEMPQHLQAIAPLTGSGTFVSTGIGGHDSLMAYYAGLPLKYELMDLFAVDYIIGVENNVYKLYVQEQDASYFSLVRAPFATTTTISPVDARELVVTWLFSDAALSSEHILLSQNDNVNTAYIFSTVENDPAFISLSEDNNAFGNKIYGDISFDQHSPYVTVDGEKVRSFDLFAAYTNATADTIDSCGTVSEEKKERGEYSVLVQVDAADCYVLFKMSYHPEWRVFVNGEEQELVHLSPAFMGAQMAAGTHEVVFVYKPFWYRFVLLGLGLVVFVAFWYWNGTRKRNVKKKEKS